MTDLIRVAVAEAGCGGFLKKREQGSLPNQLTLPFTSNFFVAVQYRMLFNSIFTSL